MSDWQERITRETAPAIRAEHELRYRLAAPLIRTSAVWADLGCGNGLAALAGLGDSRPGHLVLVDLDASAVADAAGELAAEQVSQISGDLSDVKSLREIDQTLLGTQGQRVVTCFEVVEHLGTFIPLLEWARKLAADGAATFVISVPNDAFWSVENPYHESRWGQGAFEELALLLPEERTLMRQVSLSGSALVDWEATRERHDLVAEVGGEGTVATHFIAAFGPRHGELHRAAMAAQTEQLEQRRWERQRESNLALAEALVREQRETIRSQREDLESLIAQFDEWRAYIHELEGELGRPLSGQQP